MILSENMRLAVQSLVNYVNQNLLNPDITISKWSLVLTTSFPPRYVLTGPVGLILYFFLIRSTLSRRSCSFRCLSMAICADILGSARPCTASYSLVFLGGAISGCLSAVRCSGRKSVESAFACFLKNRKIRG